MRTTISEFSIYHLDQNSGFRPSASHANQMKNIKETPKQIKVATVESYINPIYKKIQKKLHASSKHIDFFVSIQIKTTWNHQNKG